MKKRGFSITYSWRRNVDLNVRRLPKFRSDIEKLIKEYEIYKYVDNLSIEFEDMDKDYFRNLEKK